MEDFLSVMKARRSFYQLEKRSPISDDRIEELVREAVLHTPSAFHMQSARVMLLFGKQHDRLWYDIVMETLRGIVPKENFQPTEEKIDSFGKAYATVLFFDEMTVVDEFTQKFQTYAENMPMFVHNGNGMLQFAIWNLLESQGLGASLQHYNPLIDQQVRQAWELPESWRLVAQMPFGHPTALPGEKTFESAGGRMLIKR